MPSKKNRTVQMRKFKVDAVILGPLSTWLALSCFMRTTSRAFMDVSGAKG